MWLHQEQSRGKIGVGMDLRIDLSEMKLLQAYENGKWIREWNGDAENEGKKDEEDLILIRHKEKSS